MTTEEEDDVEIKPNLTFAKDSFDFPIEYTCEAVLDEGTLADSFPLSFDYEITLKDAPHGEFPIDVRRSFEWSLLWNVAIEIGLRNCSLDTQGSPPTTLDPYALFQVVALGSQIDDALDTEPAEKDPTVADGTCFSQNPACIPMKGTMNAKYVGNELEAQKYLLKMVEKVLGTNAALVDGVSSVLYVGDRGTFYNPSLHQPATPPPLAIASVSSDPGVRSFFPSETTIIGTAVALGVVAILLAGLFVMRTARKKRARKVGSESRMGNTSIEIDAGSVYTKGTQASLDESSLPTTACDVDAFIEEDAPFSSDKPDVTDKNLPTALKPISLPSKRRMRRKKKKKKKINVMGFTRSNSINSMDTIREEDEHQDDNDDSSAFGTEYSTDDEDPDIPWTDSSWKLWSEQPWDSSSSPQSMMMMPLEEIVESPKIRKLPPPPV